MPLFTVFRVFSVAAAAVSTIDWFHSRFPAILQDGHCRRRTPAAGLSLWGRGGPVWTVQPRCWRRRPRAQRQRRPRVADADDHGVGDIAAAAGPVALRVDEEAVVPVAAGEER